MKGSRKDAKERSRKARALPAECAQNGCIAFRRASRAKYNPTEVVPFESDDGFFASSFLCVFA
jgi:hypothetical protein